MPASNSSSVNRRRKRVTNNAVIVGGFDIHSGAFGQADTRRDIFRHRFCIPALNNRVHGDYPTTMRSRLNRDSNSAPSLVISTLSMMRAPSFSAPRKTGGSIVTTMPARSV